MEKKDNIEEWAKKTVKNYHEIATRSDVNIAYYTQSDLSQLIGKPELMIIGINPGSYSTYKEQCENKNWSYLYKNPLDKNHLLKGNYCHEEGKPSSWDCHRKWGYWNRLKTCLSKTDGLLDIIDDDSKIIVTNASFFSTKKANEIPESLLIETIPFTLDLISITEPKHVIFLSGKKCFERLFNLSKNTKVIQFEYKNVCGNIYVGGLNGKLCIGIPHPTYKTNEEINLVASVLPYLINAESYKSIDVASIQKECASQINDFYEMRNGNTHNASQEHIHLNKENIVKQVNNEIELSCYEQKGKTNRYKLNDKYGITITNVGKGYIGIRHIHYLNSYENTQEQEVIALKNYFNSCGYNIHEKTWIATKTFNLFGHDDNEIAKNILEEIRKLKELDFFKN